MTKINLPDFATPYTPREGVDARTRDGQRVTGVTYKPVSAVYLWQGSIDGSRETWTNEGAFIDRAEHPRPHPLDLAADWEATPAPGPSADDRAFLDAAMIAAFPYTMGMADRAMAEDGDSVADDMFELAADWAVRQAHALLRARKGGA